MLNKLLQQVPGVLLLAFWVTTSSATVVQIDSSSSVIQTGGGLAGTGYGFLSISGTFEVIETTPSSLSFTNLNIIVAPSIVSPGVTISDLLFSTASYDGYNFSNAIACVHVEGVICPDGNISGTYDGSTFALTGYYFSGNPDDYTYTSYINATAVPLPASLWLFMSGIICLFRLRKSRFSGDH